MKTYQYGEHPVDLIAIVDDAIRRAAAVVIGEVVHHLILVFQPFVVGVLFGQGDHGRNCEGGGDSARGEFDKTFLTS